MEREKVKKIYQNGSYLTELNSKYKTNNMKTKNKIQTSLIILISAIFFSSCTSYQILMPSTEHLNKGKGTYPTLTLDKLNEGKDIFSLAVKTDFARKCFFSASNKIIQKRIDKVAAKKQWPACEKEAVTEYIFIMKDSQRKYNKQDIELGLSLAF